MKIQEPNSKQLMPNFMREDETVNALCEAFDNIIKKLAPDKLHTWGQIDNFSENECDDLALELRVLWYKADGTAEEKKIQLKTSDDIWRTIGTRYAVELAISQIFGDAQLKEFWEYEEGLPHHFKITLDRAGVLTQENEIAFKRILEIVKRKSQILDAIELIMKQNFNIFAAPAFVDSSKEILSIKEQQHAEFNGPEIFGAIGIVESAKEFINIKSQI